MEKLILGFFDWLKEINFGTIFQFLGVGLLLFWVVVIGWVVADSRDRFSQSWKRFLAIAIVVLIPLFGLLMYFIIRPRTTFEEDELLELERKYLRFEAAGLGDCPSCGCELLPNYICCPHCGRELRKKCPSCEIYLEPDWNVCPFCGTRRWGKSDEIASFSPATAGSVRMNAADRMDSEENARKDALPEVSDEDRPVMNPTEADVISEVEEVANSEEDIQDEGQTEMTANRAIGGESFRAKANRIRKSLSSGQKKLLSGVDGFVKYVGSRPLTLINRMKSRTRKMEESEDVNASEEKKSEVMEIVLENPEKQNHGKKKGKRKC